MDETVRIGIDVFWDTSIQKFRKKKLNLEKCPMDYRCPNCGKILTPVERREEKPTINRYIREESETGELVKYGHVKLMRIVEPNPFYRLKPIELFFYGGVCENCYLDGFGRFGERGKSIKQQLIASGEWKIIPPNSKYL